MASIEQISSKDIILMFIIFFSTVYNLKMILGEDMENDLPVWSIFFSLSFVKLLKIVLLSSSIKQ